MTRVVVAMSGGVDSSVAAALMVEEGYDVVGLSMQLYDQRETEDGAPKFGSCCSIDDLHDAKRVAQQLGFPHYIVNFEREFKATVVDNFVREYSAGRTPIPCVHCNADLKFSTLAERAAGLDASVVATGHYARVVFDEDDRRYRLLRGVDPGKDQSYFLFTLTQYVLKLEPVGERVVVGAREALGSHELTATGVNWISGTAPEGPTRVTARIRHRHQDAPATVVSTGDGTAHLRFDDPQVAITPGQAVVFYDAADAASVLGGGWIDSR